MIAMASTRVGAWQLMPHVCQQGLAYKNHNWCISAAKRKKGAGAGDAHKLVVRHNIDFCATCCSWCLGSQSLPTPGEHHPGGRGSSCHMCANKGWHTKTTTGASAPPNGKKVLVQEMHISGFQWGEISPYL